jgi:hypothetical protein
MASTGRRKTKKERQRIEEMILLFVLLAFFLRVAALTFIPYPSKPRMENAFVVELIGMVDRYLLPLHKSGEKAHIGTVPWEGSAAQKIRDELVLPKLAEIGLRDELKPPLPRVSLFPPGELDEQAKKMILENSRFYRELGEFVYGKEREKEILDVPVPATSTAKGGAIPLPEDADAQRIIASLQETAQREEARKQSRATAALDIKGPAASRKVSYLPPPLPSKSLVDGDCLNGTVGKIVPLAQGDIRTVAAAIDQVKKFRFEPLPQGVPQVEQWGVIPAKAVLR